MDPRLLWYAPAGLVIAYLSLPLVSWLLTALRAGVRPHRVGEQQQQTAEGLVPFLFLVPAHNEARVITRCVRSLLDQDYPDELRSVVVVADNCDDETHLAATREGARSLVRVEPDDPGKPQALAWALQELGDVTRWEACVIVDADSEVAPDFAGRLAASAPLRGRVIQAYYGIANPGGSWLTRLASLLSRARYEVEYPLKSRAMLNCPLTGNGMCIGTEILAQHGWSAFSITENWELYADYTARGIRIDVANDARLFALETEGVAASRTRRSRWLRGRANVLRAYWRPILRSRAIGWHQKLDGLVELSNLPPTVHGAVAIGLALFLYTVPDDPIGPWLALATFATLAPILVASAISLVKDPEPMKTAAALLLLPPYALWRAWFFLETLLLHRGSKWEKTERT